MLPVDCCQTNEPIINFITDDMTSKFELFSKNKIKNIYLTEIMQSYWMQMLDDYWDEKYTPHSDDYDLWPDYLYKHFNGIPLGEAIESDYLAWK